MKEKLKTPSQKQVWNSIAPDWDKWKNNPDRRVISFVSNSKGNLLDLGCGSGRNFNSDVKATVYALDFSKEMLKYAEQKAKQLGINVKTIRYDLTKKLPFEDNFFDNVICVATLHCIKGQKTRQNILKEIYRVSKPKALVLIKVWNRKSKKFHNKQERLIKWGDKGMRYYYFYTEEELEKELKKAKFKILESESQREGFELQEIFILCEKVI